MKKTASSILIASAFLLAACGPQPTPLPEVEAPASSTAQPTLAPEAAVPASPTAQPPAPQESNELQVAIAGFEFSPTVLTVKVGTTVTWTNEDTAVHNVVAQDGSWGSPDMKKGDTYSYTFTTAGTYTYICTYHPRMKGTITVVS